MLVLATGAIEADPKIPYHEEMALPADKHTASAEPLLARLRGHDVRAAAEMFERYAVDVNRLVWRLLRP